METATMSQVGAVLRRNARVRALGAVAVASMASMAMAGCGKGEERAPKEQVVIGAPLGFTGPNAGTVLAAEKAWNLLLADINGAGGVLGAELVVDARDTEFVAEKEVSVVQEMVDDGIKFLLAGVLAPVFEQQLSITIPAGALVITPVMGDDGFNGPQRDGLLIRTIAPYQPVAEATARAFEEAGYRNVGFVVDSGSAASDLSRFALLRNALADVCAECTMNDQVFPFEATATYDWASYAEQTMADQPDVLVVALLGAGGRNAVSIVNALEAAGYTGKYYFAAQAVPVEAAKVFDPDVATRFHFFDILAPQSDSHSALSSRFEDAYGEPLTGNPRALGGADAMMLFALGMVQAGSTDPHAVADAIHTVANAPGMTVGPFDFAAAVAAIEAGEDINYEGASGALELDEFGDVTDAPVREFAMQADGTVGLP